MLFKEEKVSVWILLVVTIGSSCSSWDFGTARGKVVIFSLHQELTEELSKLKLRERDLKLTSEPPLLLDIENNEMHKVFTKVNQIKI